MNKKAFTLAETLITIVIVGIVAALTVPALIAKYKEEQLKSAFKTFYSTFDNALRQLSVTHGPYACFYWYTQDNPYRGKCSAKCSETNEYGTCLKYICNQTGEDLPSDYNGPRSQCQEFRDALFNKSLKMIKYCPNNAYENGCLPKDFKGTDKVKKEQDPNYTQDPQASGQFNDYHLKNTVPVYVVENGMYYFSYYKISQTDGKVEDAPVFGVDINGFKGPNKWGYDIFTFMLYGNNSVGPNRMKSIVYATEKGGKSFEQMQKESFK